MSFVAAGQTTLHFSGLDWTVKSGGGGPGPNYWSDDPAQVWVDTSGYLHMKIRKFGTIWYCSEVYLTKSFGHGTYEFEVSSDVEQYDPNIVVGLFTYETDEREIDIEFSRWDDPSNPAGWYTVQPYPYNSANQSGFPLGLQGSLSRHLFDWQADQIHFQSFKPYTLTVPPMDSLIHEWTYTGTHNPPAGNERLHINFWLFQGNPPQNQQEAELVIRTVKVPKPSAVVDEWKEPSGIITYTDPMCSTCFIIAGVTDRIQFVEITDVTGHLVHAERLDSRRAEVDLSSCKSGLYLLRIKSSHFLTVRKIRVSR